MGSSEKQYTRAKISIENLVFEFEGTEDFVSARLQEYGEKILELIPNRLEQVHAKPSAQSKKEPKDASTRKPTQKKASSALAKAKSPKISAERFDIHGNGDVPSLESFLTEKSPGRSNSEKIVVIGYYIAENIGNGKFTEGKIEYAYKMIKYKRPNHLHQIMINAKNDKDWFEQTDETGVWKLTRSGEIFVSDELPIDDG